MIPLIVPNIKGIYHPQNITFNICTYIFKNFICVYVIKYNIRKQSQAIYKCLFIDIYGRS